MSAIVELLMQTSEADTDLLIKNDERGDVLATPREVDFLLIAPTAEKAELVASFISDYRYGEVSVTSDEISHRISVRLTMPITQPVICCVSGFMACLSKVYDLEYDGWGSVIKPGT